jgi:hypothetical protein
MADERTDYSPFISDGYDIRVNESPKDGNTKPPTEAGKSNSKDANSGSHEQGRS